MRPIRGLRTPFALFLWPLSASGETDRRSMDARPDSSELIGLPSEPREPVRSRMAEIADRVTEEIVASEGLEGA